MVQFIGTSYVMFFTARKNDTLNNETNSIKEQEGTGNNQVTGNIIGTILRYTHSNILVVHRIDLFTKMLLTK